MIFEDVLREQRSSSGSNPPTRPRPNASSRPWIGPLCLLRVLPVFFSPSLGVGLVLPIHRERMRCMDDQRGLCKQLVQLM